MKKITLLLTVLFAIAFVSCSSSQNKRKSFFITTDTKNEVTIAKVSVFPFVLPVDETGYPELISPSIQNTSDEDVEVVWDESTLNGEKIFVLGSNIEEAEKSIKNSIVPAGENLMFMIKTISQAKTKTIFSKEDLPIKLKLTIKNSTKKETVEIDVFLNVR